MPESIPPLGSITSAERTAAQESGASGGRSQQQSAGDLPFAMGQQLFGRVIQVLADGAALIDLAGQQLKMSTPVALAEGQVLNVVVRGLGPVVDLELVDPPVAFSDEAYAQATVREARHAFAGAGRLSPDEVRALLDTLARLPGAASLHAKASAALLPVPLGADADRLVERLRSAIVGSGLFFEGRLAAAAEQSGAAPDGPRLENDVRTVLAELAKVASQAPGIEEARQKLANDVLSRQLDVAWGKVKDGDLRLDIPVAMGQTQTDAHLRVKEDDAGRRESGDEAGRLVDLTIELPELGRVHTSIAWTPGTLATRFAVRGPDEAGVLQHGISELTARLHAIGFRHVTARVEVDPADVEPPDRREPPDDAPPLPGGSILRVRA